MPPKRFVFRLQTVLVVKEKKEDDEKKKYGDLIQLLAQEQRRLVQIQHDRVQTEAELKTKLQNNQGLQVDELKRYGIWKEQLKKAEEKQKLRIIEVEEALERQRIALTEAMKERKTLETLKEQQQEQFNREIDEEEAKMIDELATLKYARDAGTKEEE
jgi:flagellar export protein FliJ